MPRHFFSFLFHSSRLAPHAAGLLARALLFGCCALPGSLPLSLGAETVRVATYNVENYLVMDRVVEGRWRPDYPKPEDNKRALREVIAAVNADILALQEMGPEPFLVELQRDLKAEGLDYPHSHLLQGSDEVRHLAVLSRLPFAEVHEHIEPDFPYFEERERIRRGLLEIVFANNGETWSLFVVHLKSKWTERADDPLAERKRTAEATAARNVILSRHDPEGGALYLIAGDFNDTRETAPLRRFFKRGDTLIAHAVPAHDSRGHAWTQHWERQNLYSRVDFLLASPAMMERIVDEAGSVYDGPGNEVASDHRLVWTDIDFSAPAKEAVADSSSPGDRLGDLLQSFRE